MPASAAPWPQAYDPFHHWWLSTLFAALPIAVLLGCMGILKLKAHIAALIALASILLLALFGFHMPPALAASSALYGMAYGFFPICWIVIPIIFLYQLTVKSGSFDLLRASLITITEDSRLQLLLIAFALGAFFEGAAGFGTPVAVCGTILIGLGFRPIKAAGLALLANTAPVAFGSLGIPIIALHGVTGFDMLVLSKVIGRLLTPFCFLIPFWLIWAQAGFRKMLEVWPALLVAGATFGLSQLLISNLHGPWLVDIGAALITILALTTFLRFWKPRRLLDPHGNPRQPASATTRHGVVTIYRAWSPWLLLTIFLVLWGSPFFTRIADRLTLKLSVPLLDHMVLRTPPIVLHATPEPAIFTFNWLSAAGTGIFIAAIAAGLMMRLSPLTLLKQFLHTLFHVRFTIITITCMMALGYISRYCGLDATLGLAFARTGVLYPFFGTFIGWLGTASTGSDTSSNVLFGGLQKLTAQQIGISPVLMCSANSTGGVMAKMVSPQSLVIASTATESYGSEGSILKFVFLHSIALTALMGLAVTLLAYAYPFTTLIPK
jgi:lactate permease